MPTGVDYLVVPKGDGVGRLKLFLGEILTNQKRLDEVAYVTGHKAPELLTAFNRSWLKLKEMHTRLSYEKARADGRLKEVRAEVRLGLNDGAVKAHGFAKSSADLRNALVEVDQRTKDVRENLNFITAATEYVAGKMRAFENGYTAVKRILSVTPPGAPVKSTQDPGRNSPFEEDPAALDMLSKFGNAR